MPQANDPVMIRKLSIEPTQRPTIAFAGCR